MLGRRTGMMAALIMLLICAGAQGAGGAALPREPKAALAAIQAAINDGDGAAFAKLIDLDAILDNAGDIFFKQAGEPDKQGLMPPMLALLFSRAASRPQVRTLLRQEARAFVLGCVNSGSFAGRKNAAAKMGGLFGPLFASASAGKKEITSIGDVRKDGDGWLAEFTLRDYENGESYPIIAEFAQQDGLCRLTGIRNLEELITRIEKEAAAQ